MGQYRASIITDSGQQLIADALSGGGTVTFTAIKTSSHVYPEGTNIAGLTELQDIVQTVSPSSVQVFNETMIQVSGRFDNSQITQAYFIQTLGLYAKLEAEDEILFAVIQADTPDQMPAQSAVSPSAFVFNIQTTVQQASSISVTVDPAGTVTVEDLLNMGNQKVDKQGGDISNTVISAIEQSTDSFPILSIGDTVKKAAGKINKCIQDILGKFGNYILTSAIRNQQINDTGTVPSSALVYLMQQAIVANQNSISGLNTKLEKIVFGTYISVPDNGLIIIPANGIANGMALAINGDYEADDSFYVVGVWTDNNIIKVKLSKNDIGNQVRINYVYVKS